MTDIPSLIERLNRWFAYENCGPIGPMAEDIKDAASALSSLARENERLRAGLTSPTIKIQDEQIRLLAAERDAIKTKTFEECIAAGEKIAKDWYEDAEGRVAEQPRRYHEHNISVAHGSGAEEVVEAIRSLAEQKEG